MLNWLDQVSLDRQQYLMQRGVRNAWTEGALSPQFPVRIVIVDESAELFAGFQMTGPSTDTKREAVALASDANVKLGSLMRRGRALGYVNFVSTQKPTAASVPSDIRDITNVRAAFRVSSYPGAVAILGPRLEGLHRTEEPWNIAPQDRGQATVTLEDGSAERVQTPYISTEQIRQALADTAHLARPWQISAPTQPTPPTQQPAPQPEPGSEFAPPEGGYAPPKLTFGSDSPLPEDFWGESDSSSTV